MSDDLFTSARLPDFGVRALYLLENRWQAWLDVEGALAQSEEEVGVIPAGMGSQIARCAKLSLLDRAKIDDEIRRTSHPIVPLIWELARVAGEPAGGWVHWGATTQNIIQTGDLIVLRQAHDKFYASLRRSLHSMAELAQRTADMVMAGRTHGQHAVPITFGFKVAVWIDEFLRHRERLRELDPRVFRTMIGGAAGTYASLGSDGPLVETALARRLGMQPMAVPSRTTLDHLAEYILVLGLIAASCGKIGREIYALMKTEIGEAEEPVPVGTVGSSTMPQKRNPQLCQDIVAMSAELRSIVPIALEAVQVEHEADRTSTLMLRDATKRAVTILGDVFVRIEVLMAGLTVDADRMHRNLDLGGGLIMAEAVMLSLGQQVGRQTAHDVVYEAAQRAIGDHVPFGALLAADKRVAEHLQPAAITSLLDPSHYVGLAPQMARDMAQRARAET